MRTSSGIELGFDMRGNLKPNVKIELTFDEFQEIFISAFANIETSRARIFQDYLNFLDDFKSLVSRDFKQWINGSFISKKQSPNDIDLIIEPMNLTKT